MALSDDVRLKLKRRSTLLLADSRELPTATRVWTSAQRELIKEALEESAAILDDAAARLAPKEAEHGAV